MCNYTGNLLKAARLRAGLTQQQLADKAGYHRLAVGYWENKNGKFTARYGAPCAFAKALGVKYYYSPLRTRAGWGFTESENARIDREVAQLAQLRAKRFARARVRCDAKTRKGTPCKAMSESGKRRCKYHGGLSTGPKTDAGKAIISRAQKSRWKVFRRAKLENGNSIKTHMADKMGDNIE